MDDQLLPPSPSETPKPSASTDSLIREWLFRFGVEHKEDVAPRLPLWQEAFAEIEPKMLESLFRRAMRTCKFFPKVPEILEPLENAENNAAPEAAEEAWEYVLDLRRRYWNPDVPGGFYRGMPKLSERVQQAARAAGVFRDFESAEGLHVWAKKRFVESFIAWDELQQAKFLLPDGELKNLLADAAQAKALSSTQVSYEDLHQRGLRYAEQVKAKTAAQVEGLVKQLKSLREGMSEEERAAINEGLRQYGVRFAAALERHRQETAAAEKPA